jgi:hypothetical protein
MDGAGGVFEDCDIGGTGYPGLYVGAGARPRVRRIDVHDVAQGVEDIVVHESAAALVERVPRPPQGAPGSASRPDTLPDAIPDAVPDLVPSASPMPLVSTSVPPVATLPPTHGKEPAAETTAGILAELDAAAELGPAKRAIEDVVSWTRRERRRLDAGLPPRPAQRNLILAGALGPDTGHAAVARTYGRVLRALGVLSSGHVAATSLAELAADTGSARAACARAAEGVLFVECERTPDESRARTAAESLAGALEECDEAGRAVVTVLAGPADTARRLAEADPRLAGRFRRIVPFATVAAESDAAHGES